MVYIYILQLEKGKYYVGKTNNPKFRINNHFESNGSAWTRLYKPLKVLELKNNCDDYDEDKITIQCMNKYGIDNVRGGSFVSVKLDQSSIDTLERMNNGANDKCFNCGNKGHFANECYDGDEVDEVEDEEEIVWQCCNCGKEFETKKGVLFHQNIYCNKTLYESSYESSEEYLCEYSEDGTIYYEYSEDES